MCDANVKARTARHYSHIWDTLMFASVAKEQIWAYGHGPRCGPQIPKIPFNFFGPMRGLAKTCGRLAHYPEHALLCMFSISRTCGCEPSLSCDSLPLLLLRRFTSLVLARLGALRGGPC